MLVTGAYYRHAISRFSISKADLDGSGGELNGLPGDNGGHLLCVGPFLSARVCDMRADCP